MAKQPLNLPEEVREAMWQAWQEKSSVTHVCKKCEIHHSVVKRYREADKWDERMEQQADEIRRIENINIAQEKAKHFKIIDGLYLRTAKRIEEQFEKDPDFVPSIKDLNLLFRAHCALIGVMLVDNPNITNIFNVDQSKKTALFLDNLSDAQRSNLKGVVKEILTKKNIDDGNGRDNSTNSGDTTADSGDNGSDS